MDSALKQILGWSQKTEFEFSLGPSWVVPSETPRSQFLIYKIRMKALNGQSCMGIKWDEVCSVRTLTLSMSKGILFIEDIEKKDTPKKS